MKKKIAGLICITAVVSGLLVGCAGGLSGASGSGAFGEDAQNYEEESAVEASAGELGAEQAEEQATADSGSDGENFADGAWLPEGAVQMASETEPNEAVRTAIIDEYVIPEEEWEETRYYYNYVDLDDDGENEIFALAVGPSLSGSGGSSALLMKESGEVIQTFTLINPPVLVTDEIMNGYRELALVRSGGGAETEVVLLSYGNGAYETVSETETVIDPDLLSGTAILCNDLAADMESGNYLTLSE